MKPKQWIASLALAAGLMALSPMSAMASLVNGDFQTGDLTGWTTFVTTNGTNGTSLPDVIAYDTTNTATPSLSARFNVGQVVYQSGGPAAGGGIYQNVNLAAGLLSIGADIASVSSLDNAAAGLFELLIDGVVADSHDFGSHGANFAVFSTLSASQAVTAGLHEIRLRITRPYLSSDRTPHQYLDNVTIELQSDPVVPEPATLMLVGLGLSSAGWLKRRRRA